MDLGRLKVIRTGRPVFSAARPSSGCTDMSSFEPKPPPTAEGRMRTRSGGSASTAAVSWRSMYGAWVQARITSVSPSSQAAPASGSM